METFLHYLSHFHYIGLFIGLFLCGVGFPFPEDIFIISGGYLAYQGTIEIIPTLFVLWIGAMSGNILLYFLGRRYGTDLLKHRRFNWFFTPKRIHALNHYFHKYGNRTLFFARFLVGLRATIFLTTGAFQIPFKRVLLFDGASALISVLLIASLSFYFGNHIDSLLIWMKRVEHGLLFVGVGVAIFVVWRVYRFFHATHECEKPEEIDPIDVNKD